ncbi:MAG: DUF4865 family protein [Pseudonocardiales bacterium]
MYAMQYEITLPADYDMGIIRHRVATRGSGTDALAGLGMKAYAIREKGVGGSPVNQYAPFYLWNTLDGMNAFLFGPGFAGLSGDFGRPAVQRWSGVSFERGSAGGVPVLASRRTWRVHSDDGLDDALADGLRAIERLRTVDGVHSTALAVDAQRWEFVQFTLWAQDPGEIDATRYEVLHTSVPGLADLAAAPPPVQ